MSTTEDGGRAESPSSSSNAAAVPKAGRISEFFAWWLNELSDLSPGWLKQAFFSRPAIAIAFEQDGQLFLKRNGAKPVTVGPPARAARVGGAAVIFVLPEDSVLKRQRRLPRATLPHVQSIMTLQIPSDTPFTIDEVHSDTRVTGEDERMGEILVEQALAPKTAVEDARQRAADAGLKLAGIDVADHDSKDGRAGFNMLPAFMRAPVRSGASPVNRALLVVLAVSLAFAGWSWRNLQDKRIASAEAALAASETEASGALAMHAAARQGAEAIAHVSAASKDKLQFTHVYEALSALTPDGAWLEEIEYTRPTALITGLAPDSATLIGALEASSLVSAARFVSPVVMDARFGAERFRIEVTFKDGKNGKDGNGAEGAPPAGDAP